MFDSLDRCLNPPIEPKLFIRCVDDKGLAVCRSYSVDNPKALQKCKDEANEYQNPRNVIFGSLLTCNRYRSSAPKAMTTSTSTTTSMPLVKKQLIISITLLLLSTLFFHRPISTSVVLITRQINRRVESTIWKLAPIGCRLANFKMNFKNQPSSFSIQLSNAWCIKVANPKKNISKSSVLLLTFHFSSFEKGWTYQPWASPPAPYNASHIDNAVDNNQPSLSLPEWCFL